jgi:hypothetical protein
MSVRSIAAVSTCFVLLGVAVPPPAVGQDYAMYETQYLTVLPGHGDKFNEKMTEHNQRFHSEGPYTAQVFFIINGPRSGQIFWAMGPTTFTQLDSRPSGEPHDPDWRQNVLSHAEVGTAEYWRLNDDLSSLQDPDAAPQPLSRVRFFEVADNALFMKTQEQIEATLKALGNTRARSFYRKQFAHRDGRDWALVQSYDNWAELDEPRSGSFQETFVEIHGLSAWSQFEDDRAAAVVGMQDEWRQRIP